MSAIISLLFSCLGIHRTKSTYRNSPPSTGMDYVERFVLHDMPQRNSFPSKTTTKQINSAEKLTNTASDPIPIPSSSNSLFKMGRDINALVMDHLPYSFSNHCPSAYLNRLT
jgi:hypothetical protein